MSLLLPPPPPPPPSEPRGSLVLDQRQPALPERRDWTPWWSGLAANA